MIGVIAFLCGVGFGVAISAIAWLATRPPGPPRRELPPATARRIARAARANRAQLRIRPWISPQLRDERHWVSPANGDFDDGDTQ